MVINDYRRRSNSPDCLENNTEIYMNRLHYSQNTVGCNVGGKIFIHPKLYTVPKLYHAVVSHEKKHSDGFNGHDVAIDLFNDELKDCKVEFYKFMFKHPRTLLGYLPITKVGRYWGFDLQMLIAWAMIIGFAYFLGVNL